VSRLALAHLDKIGQRLFECDPGSGLRGGLFASSLSGSTTSMTPLIPSSPSMLGATASILPRARLQP